MQLCLRDHAVLQMSRETVFKDEDGWWFWEEDWFTADGPYPTEGIAREMLELYIRHLNGEDIQV